MRREILERLLLARVELEAHDHILLHGAHHGPLELDGQGRAESEEKAQQLLHFQTEKTFSFCLDQIEESQVRNDTLLDVSHFLSQCRIK